MLPTSRIELYANDEVKHYKHVVKERTYRRLREYPGDILITRRLRQRLKFLYFIVDTSKYVMDKNSISFTARKISMLSQNFYIFLCIFSYKAYEFDLGKNLGISSIINIFEKFKVHGEETILSSALEKMIKRGVKKGIVISNFEFVDLDESEKMVEKYGLKLFGIVINDNKKVNQIVEKITHDYIFIDINDLRKEP